MNFIEYLQQPGSLYAIMTLVINTQVHGFATKTEMAQWLIAETGNTVNVADLEQRWKDLFALGFTMISDSESHGCREISYVFTEKGEKMAQALLDCVDYIKSL